MIDFDAAAHAVLSQNSLEHLGNLSPADRSVLNQAADHAHMFDYRHRPVVRLVTWNFGRIVRTNCCPAFIILLALLDLPILPPVVIDAALGGTLSAVSILAAKGTSQVRTTGVARVRQKENAAMPAPGQAGSQTRLGSQNRSQKQIILQHQGGYRPSVIPVRPELEMLLDLDCKKPKLSLRMLMKY
jgi:hypothetical protein